MVVGVDEVGRGPLIGPVVAAAVVLPDNHAIVGLADSKKLTPKRREKLAIEIQAKAVVWAISEASEQEIDAINILQASLLAMQRAVEKAQSIVSRDSEAVITKALIDGNKIPKLNIAAEAIVKGDT
ncbi:MAG: ribonuclease HII, partial [Thiotrichales bacterium]|nr:ribonuclease HII [Thiotrichales bacterium]MBT3837678.1 ribonuclease HII [Thiotrichales bacterium]MBT4152286.1 ribonuclease HII [Thiotrichales bacterium]MBT4261602.1 ribonuclease HII [Thiotrichales bacterium]MBT4574781.1 ribonuclease HII [Thiotrichales bacterium]